MSVFTTVSREALNAWLAPLDLGPLENFQGITAGVENSNYFVDTPRQRFVLTLFEHLAPEQLTFYLGLQTELVLQGFPCPQPQGNSPYWRPLAGKPAVLFNRLPGQTVEVPSVDQCARIGSALARLHRLAVPPGAPPHCRNLEWRQRAGSDLAPQLPAAEQTLLRQALAEDAALAWNELPRGLIHADLFRDNVLWEGAKLGGILDFYFAGTEVLLFDLAVLVNDWCLDALNQLDRPRLRAVLQAYQNERPLCAGEIALWPNVLASAALRFWLSRLMDTVYPRPGSVVTIKDPDHFRRLLEHLRGEGARIATQALSD